VESFSNKNMWDNYDLHQLHKESMDWFGCRSSEIYELCFK